MTATHSYLQISPGILPTRTRINPTKPHTAEYFDPAQIGYLVGDGKAVRLITSFGQLNEDWALGTYHRLLHDQTGGNLGDFHVIGILAFEDASADTPARIISGVNVDRSIPHYVFK
jgi:hypothetical protein